MRNSTNRIAVYGSLRDGQYNFERFKQAYPDIKVLKNDVILKGFNLYTLGSYPGIKVGDGEIEVDILEVNDMCFNNILRMEFGAGYSLMEIFVDDKQTGLFIYEGPVKENMKIESGNWNNHTRRTHEQN